jgi:hypothetical protein
LENFLELARAKTGDSERTAIPTTLEPLPLQTESKKKRAEATCDVIPALAPVQARPAECTSSLWKAVELHSKFD